MTSWGRHLKSNLGHSVSNQPPDDHGDAADADQEDGVFLGLAEGDGPVRIEGYSALQGQGNQD